MRVELVRYEHGAGYGSRPVYRTDCGRFEITKCLGYSRDHAHRKIAWLCIRPLTPDAPLHDWRIMQQIENLICGPQYEAVEIVTVHPADSLICSVFPYGQAKNMACFQLGQAKTPKNQAVYRVNGYSKSIRQKST